MSDNNNKSAPKKSELRVVSGHSDEIFLNAIINGIDDVIYVADPDSYNLLYVNETARKFWGQDIVGKKCYKVLQNRNEPCSFCTNHIIFNEKPGETHVWEFQNEVTKQWFRCADKAIKWIDGRMVRFELASEITDFKLSQENLEAANHQLKAVEKQLLAANQQLKAVESDLRREVDITDSLLDSIPGIFYQINTVGKFVRTNRNFQELMGKTENEMKDLNAVDLFEGDEKNLVGEAMQKVFVEGISNVEASLVTKDKKIRFFFTGVLKEIDGESCLIGVGSDITQLKKVEDELRKTNKELELFNKMAVGREKMMIELKGIINQLNQELGRKEPYDISFSKKT